MNVKLDHQDKKNTIPAVVKIRPPEAMSARGPQLWWLAIICLLVLINAGLFFLLWGGY